MSSRFADLFVPSLHNIRRSFVKLCNCASEQDGFPLGGDYVYDNTKLHNDGVRVTMPNVARKVTRLSIHAVSSICE